MATYTLVPPSPASSGIDQQSQNFTLTADAATITGSLVITPAVSGGSGVFSPTTVTLTDGAKTGTFKYTPSTPGVHTISTTNSQSGTYTDPAGVAYTAIASAASAETILKNVSGKRMSFSFLGPRGVTLDAGEKYAIPGDVYSSPYLRYRSRDYDDFLRALTSGKLQILSTPATIVRDTATGAVKEVKATSGTLGVKNPSWGAYTDS